MNLYMQLVLCVGEEFYDVLCLHGALLERFMTFSVPKFVTISGFIGMQIDMILNVSTNILCLCGY